MKITTLIEDTARDEKLFCELGLSLLIETADTRILLDTGKSGRFADNAAALGVDLAAVDTCVLSHGHYDHGGGLDRFFRLNSRAPLYMHPTATAHLRGSACAKMPQPIGTLLHPFIKTSMKLSRPIGLDRSVIQKHAPRIRRVSGTCQIQDNIYILTDIRQHHPIPPANRFLMISENGRLLPDPFRHEIVLAVREKDGVVVFSGCCHNGILNMIDAVRDFFDNPPIKAVVGGFHLVLQPGKPAMACSAQQAAAIADELADKGVEKIYTGHCTGQEAFDALKSRLGGRMHRLTTGLVFSV